MKRGCVNCTQKKKNEHVDFSSSSANAGHCGGNCPGSDARAASTPTSNCARTSHRHAGGSRERRCGVRHTRAGAERGRGRRDTRGRYLQKMPPTVSPPARCQRRAGELLPLRRVRRTSRLGNPRVVRHCLRPLIKLCASRYHPLVYLFSIFFFPFV